MASDEDLGNKCIPVSMQNKHATEWEIDVLFIQRGLTKLYKNENDEGTHWQLISFDGYIKILDELPRTTTTGRTCLYRSRNTSVGGDSKSWVRLLNRTKGVTRVMKNYTNRRWIHISEAFEFSQEVHGHVYRLCNDNSS